MKRALTPQSGSSLRRAQIPRSGDDTAAAPARLLDDLDVVFLVWRESPAMLERHHRSVASALPRGWRGNAVLVENHAGPRTTDAARTLLARHYPDARRTVLRLPGNLGFGRAINLGLDACTGRWAAVLNSDGHPEPDMLEILVQALERRPDAIWAAPGVHGRGERCDAPGPPSAHDRLAGTALVIRRDRFLALGGFDPMYFFYSEDYDASDRLREHGQILLRVPDARFNHSKGGRSRRGIFLREALYALSDQTLVHHHAVSRRRAAARVARGRLRSLTEHVRGRDTAAVAGILLATLAWPGSALAAERRRRRRWDGVALDAWLAKWKPKVQRLSL